MPNHQTQQPKSTPKRETIASLISLLLGIVSIVPTIIVLLLVLLLFLTAPEAMTFFLGLGWIIKVAYPFYGMSILTAIIGIILGIVGLKSTKRKFAITGIVLCVSGLLLSLAFFLFLEKL